MDDNKDSRSKDDIDLVELDQENEDQDTEPDEWEDDWEDEPEPMSAGKMVLVFAGLLIAAVVICAILWSVTHRDSGAAPEGDAAEPPAVTTETPDSELPPGEEDTDPISGTEEDADLYAGLDRQAGQDEEVNSDEQVNSDGQADPDDQSANASASEPDEPSTPQEPQNGDSSMRFDAAEESVTPKDVVNLRSVPSTADADTVVTQAGNGEVLTRVGINTDTGWSQIDYNGQILYAVTQYLTTDLSYKTPVASSDPNRVTTISGRVIIFTDCDDQITPKEYVNLRTEPSTTEGNATVSCQVSYGEFVHRTGISADSGWSRVEYNGQVLYVVTSLMSTNL